MRYSNKKLENYVNKIKLTQDRKSSYSTQIDSLKRNVTHAINSMDSAKVTKVKRAGSWKKGTALAPKGEYPLDVDMVFYLDVDEDTRFDAEELREGIIDTLCQAYPTKERSDFSGGPKTVGVVFVGSGLEVDIVPFIPEVGNTSYGRQPRKVLNSGEFLTSVEKQLDFASKVKDKCQSFASIVRILKSWRNYKELEVSSFSIELLVSHLVKTGKISSSIENAVVSFFELVGSDRHLEIYFEGAIGEKSGDAPWVADPTNNANNTINMCQSSWNETVQQAETGYETISYAQEVAETGKTLNLWREIFGPSFSVHE
ncbi:MAG: CBASS oligonucleotide cyclase [Candidatus Dadabacteria bacterium]|nr:CBASS oligonucleotide cyclase [Candidatus Dadabacteria bacterium]